MYGFIDFNPEIWAYIQTNRFAYREKHHRVIQHLPPKGQATNIALKASRLVGEFYSTTDRYEPIVLRLLLCAVDILNLFNVKLSGPADLELKNEVTEKIVKLGIQGSSVIYAGSMCALCERLDHLESCDYRGGLIENARGLLYLCLVNINDDIDLSYVNAARSDKELELLKYYLMGASAAIKSEKYKVLNSWYENDMSEADEDDKEIDEEGLIIASTIKDLVRLWKKRIDGTNGISFSIILTALINKESVCRLNENSVWRVEGVSYKMREEESSTLHALLVACETLTNNSTNISNFCLPLFHVNDKQNFLHEVRSNMVLVTDKEIDEVCNKYNNLYSATPEDIKWLKEIIRFIRTDGQILLRETVEDYNVWELSCLTYSIPKPTSNRIAELFDKCECIHKYGTEKSHSYSLKREVTGNDMVESLNQILSSVEVMPNTSESVLEKDQERNDTPPADEVKTSTETYSDLINKLNDLWNTKHNQPKDATLFSTVLTSLIQDKEVYCLTYPRYWKVNGCGIVLNKGLGKSLAEDLRVCGKKGEYIEETAYCFYKGETNIDFLLGSIRWKITGTYIPRIEYLLKASLDHLCKSGTVTFRNDLQDWVVGNKSFHISSLETLNCCKILEGCGSIVISTEGYNINYCKDPEKSSTELYEELSAAIKTLNEVV